MPAGFSGQRAPLPGAFRHDAEAKPPLIAQRLMSSGLIDLLDMSLWDVFKEPEEEEFKSKPLIEWFTAAGSWRGPPVRSRQDPQRSRRPARVLAAGVDALTIGRAAILHHDFPERCRDDPFFEPVELPVTPDYLRSEGFPTPSSST